MNGDKTVQANFEGISVSGVVFVDDNPVGTTNDGSSWAEAFTRLQDAIDAAGSSTEVWCAEGTYYPTKGTGRTIGFELKSGIKIYGGFISGLTNKSSRSLWTEHETVLSGDIGTKGNNSDNSYHVVYGANDILLDGLIIERGNANGSDGSNDQGAGLYSYGAYTLQINNCSFRTNDAANGNGAAVYAASDGFDDANPFYITITNSLFYSNTGGAIDLWAGESRIENCILYDNSASAEGYGGNGIRVYYGKFECIHSTITLNEVGLFFGELNDSARVKNSIIWGNSTTEVHSDFIPYTFEYVCVDTSNYRFDGMDNGNIGNGTNVFNAPQFQSATSLFGSNNTFGDPNDGLRPQNSECLNSAPKVSGVDTDITGASRNTSYVDMGAYEQ
jgi:hypothetical protein